MCFKKNEWKDVEGDTGIVNSNYWIHAGEQEVCSNPCRMGGKDYSHYFRHFNINWMLQGACAPFERKTYIYLFVSLVCLISFPSRGHRWALHIPKFCRQLSCLLGHLSGRQLCPRCFWPFPPSINFLKSLVCWMPLLNIFNMVGLVLCYYL